MSLFTNTTCLCHVRTHTHMHACMQVRMLADMHLDLTKALDVTLDAEGLLGTKRCKR